jgi:hypothetical protein
MLWNMKDVWWYCACFDWIDWLQLGSGPCNPDAPRLLLTGSLCPNLIYGSPVTLPKFQMAPRLTFLIPSGSKTKGSLTYLSGSPAKKPSQEAHHTEPLQRQTLHSYSLLHPSLKVPGRGASFQAPQRGCHGNTRCPSPEPFLTILQGP